MAGWQVSLEVQDEGAPAGLDADERVVGESEMKEFKSKVRELERLLGKKTMEVEILKEVVEYSREKDGCRHARCRNRAVADEGAAAVSVSRSGLPAALARRTEERASSPPESLSILTSMGPLVSHQLSPLRDA